LNFDQRVIVLAATPRVKAVERGLAWPVRLAPRLFYFPLTFCFCWLNFDQRVIVLAATPRVQSR
jgi:hypothetical protein